MGLKHQMSPLEGASNGTHTHTPNEQSFGSHVVTIYGLRCSRLAELNQGYTYFQGCIHIRFGLV